MALSLNKNQMLAVSHKDGPMMVLAGPGSGKTMVITHRTRHLINENNIKPEHILVITFTKASAMEMKDRFHNLVGDKVGSKVTFGTFHSVFYRILRSYYKYDLNDLVHEDKKNELFRQIIKELNIDYEDEKEFISELISELSLMKSDLIKLKYYNAKCCSNEDFTRIVMAYEKYKRDQRKIDFDDMLIKCWRLLTKNEKVLMFWQNKYKYILIDEFQDINRVQYETIKLLANPNNNLFIVGDDDQSIYQFRGAQPEFLLNFPNEFEDSGSVILNNNYRSTKCIVKSSENVIKNNNKRYKKNIVTENNEGQAPVVIEAKDLQDEAVKVAQKILELNQKSCIPLSEMAVIYRTNIQARSLLDIFLDMNIPFILRDKTANLYEHWIAKDIIAYMTLAGEIKNKDALIRIINKPKRYISKAIIEKCKKTSDNMWEGLYEEYNDQQWMINRLEELQYHLQNIKRNKPSDILKYIRNIVGYDEYLTNYAEFRKIGVEGLFEILDELQDSMKNYNSINEWLQHIEEFKKQLEHREYDINEDAVTLTTMHSAKGLEFCAVWIIGAVEGLIPHEKSNRDKDIEEERRLFYVGMTRAKERDMKKRLRYLGLLKN